MQEIRAKNEELIEEMDQKRAQILEEATEQKQT
jgi:hypothetical protein